MEVEFRTSFTRDLRRIRSAQLRQRVLRKVEELEAASTIEEVSGSRRLTADGQHYRVRIGDYRLGVTMESDVAVLVRFLHRREILPGLPLARLCTKLG